MESQNSMHPTLKSEKRPLDDKLNKGTLEAKKDIEQPQKKRKLDEQSKGICAKSSSATVKAEVIFPNMPICSSGEVVKCQTFDNEEKLFEPTEVAAKKFLMLTETQKAEDNNKRDEAVVLSSTSEVENSQMQPLKSDAEMLNAEKNTEQKPKIWLVPIEKLVKPNLLSYYYTAFGNVEHRENKASLNLDKHTCKPGVSDIAMQTDPVEEFPDLLTETKKKRYRNIAKSMKSSRRKNTKMLLHLKMYLIQHMNEMERPDDPKP